MNTDITPHEALIQFLYQAPIGLIQTTRDGEISMINPMAVTLLMPLVPDGNLVNLFDVLGEFAPGLRERSAVHDRPGEAICDMAQLSLPADPLSGARARTLGMRLVLLDATTLMATVTDITASVLLNQERLAARLLDASRTDSLTGLPKRSVVLEAIAHALAQARVHPDRQFAVMHINGDRFNQVNILLGRALGDAVLRSVADRLLRMTLPGAAFGADVVDPPTLLATRLEGDEFVVLMEGRGCAEHAHAVAQRIVDVLREPHAIGEHRIHMSASIGLMVGAPSGCDADSVLQDAGIAMRESQRAGGGRYTVFEPLLKEREALRGSIESDLRRALETGGLFVVYQPIVSMVEGACVGMEALVRWNHPERGMVSPIEFIGIAEETGLIGALGNFVLNEACREFAGWKRHLGAQAPRSISVNVSRAQLADPGFAGEVREALRASGMDAGNLQLEVTESLAAQGASVQAQLHELKALGVTLALDDFGTGYSSLACLHQLPVDVVKIDRSFVSRVESSAHHRVLIEATILVARSLGMGTVAEGIETEGQARELAQLRCDKGQGYLFAKPLAAADAIRWLLERSGSTVAA